MSSVDQVRAQFRLLARVGQLTYGVPTLHERPRLLRTAASAVRAYVFVYGDRLPDSLVAKGG